VSTIPQLSNSTAKAVEEAESLDFTPLPEDVYVLVLKEEVEAKEGPNGVYWKWAFEVVSTGSGDETHKGRKLWTNTSLGESAMWKLKEVFSGFGVPATTNTDDLIGCKVKALVVQRPIEKGSRAGEMGNDIKQILPAEGADAAPARGSRNGKKDDDLPLF